MEEETQQTEQTQTPAHVIDNPAKAINVLVNAVEHATRLGAYSIQEAKIIYDSIVFFRPDRSVEAVNAAAAAQGDEDSQG